MAYKAIPAERKVQKAVHFILQMIALVAGILGVYTAFKFKHEIGAKNMVSIHSWLGMITICLFGLQVINFYTLYYMSDILEINLGPSFFEHKVSSAFP